MKPLSTPRHTPSFTEVAAKFTPNPAPQKISKEEFDARSDQWAQWNAEDGLQDAMDHEGNTSDSDSDEARASGGASSLAQKGELREWLSARNAAAGVLNLARPPIGSTEGETSRGAFTSGARKRKAGATPQGAAGGKVKLEGDSTPALQRTYQNTRGDAPHTAAGVLLYLGGIKGAEFGSRFASELNISPYTNPGRSFSARQYKGLLKEEKVEETKWGNQRTAAAFREGVKFGPHFEVGAPSTTETSASPATEASPNVWSALQTAVAAGGLASGNMAAKIMGLSLFLANTAAAPIPAPRASARSPASASALATTASTSTNTNTNTNAAAATQNATLAFQVQLQEQLQALNSLANNATNSFPEFAEGVKFMTGILAELAKDPKKAAEVFKEVFSESPPDSEASQSGQVEAYLTEHLAARHHNGTYVESDVAAGYLVSDALEDMANNSTQAGEVSKPREKRRAMAAHHDPKVQRQWVGEAKARAGQPFDPKHYSHRPYHQHFYDHHKFHNHAGWGKLTHRVADGFADYRYRLGPGFRQTDVDDPINKHMQKVQAYDQAHGQGAWAHRHEQASLQKLKETLLSLGYKFDFDSLNPAQQQWVQKILHHSNPHNEPLTISQVRHERREGIKAKLLRESKHPEHAGKNLKQFYGAFSEGELSTDMQELLKVHHSASGDALQLTAKACTFAELMDPGRDLIQQATDIARQLRTLLGDKQFTAKQTAVLQKDFFEGIKGDWLDLTTAGQAFGAGLASALAGGPALASALVIIQNEIEAGQRTTSLSPKEIAATQVGATAWQFAWGMLVPGLGAAVPGIAAYANAAARGKADFCSTAKTALMVAAAGLAGPKAEEGEAAAGEAAVGEAAVGEAAAAELQAAELELSQATGEVQEALAEVQQAETEVDAVNQEVERHEARQNRGGTRLCKRDLTGGMCSVNSGKSPQTQTEVDEALDDYLSEDEDLSAGTPNNWKDILDEVRTALSEKADFVSSKSGSCDTTALKVKERLDRLSDENPDIKIGGKTIFWWKKEGFDFSEYGHTAVTIKYQGKEVVVDTTHSQFGGYPSGIRDNVYFASVSDWAADTLKRARAQGGEGKIKGRLVTGNAMFYPESSDMPPQPSLTPAELKIYKKQQAALQKLEKENYLFKQKKAREYAARHNL